MSTELILIRHGVTEHTTGKIFSGGLTGANPPLSELGRTQIRAALGLIGEVDAIVASPVLRARQSADLLAAAVGLPVTESPGLAEMDFGAWEGREMAEVLRTEPDAFASFFASIDQPAGGSGDSLLDAQARVRVARDELVASYQGQRIAVFSHVTPIKILVADAIGAPLESVYRSNLTPGGVSRIEVGRRSQRLLGFNLVLPDHG
ncbi:MAG TPA: histidine phosphatase family protein [Marmoricola sp.]|nr:histidine phosphatase family protein [Marmoricola sp.]